MRVARQIASLLSHLPSLISGSHPDGFLPIYSMPTSPDSPPAGSHSIPL